jgi:hypothetical protein
MCISGHRCLVWLAILHVKYGHLKFPSTWEKSLVTSLTLLRTINPYLSSLLRNTHLVPMLFLFLGGGGAQGPTHRCGWSCSTLLTLLPFKDYKWFGQLDDPWRFAHVSLAEHLEVLVVVVCDCLVLEFVIGLCNQLGLVLGLKVLGLLIMLEKLSCLLIHSH